MTIETDDLEEARIDALDHMTAQKKKIEKYYNSRVKAKFFSDGELVWKIILPVRLKNRTYGKWYPNWEVPFRMKKILQAGAYQFESLEGT